MLEIKGLTTIKNLPKKSVRNEAGDMTLDLMLPDHSVEDRLNLFFDFLAIFDAKDDVILRNNPKTFSHGLHWDEDPIVQTISEYRNSQGDLAAAELCLILGFSGENLDLVKFIASGRSFSEWGGKLVRGDLYQIWWPGGMKASEFISDCTKPLAKRLIQSNARALGILDVYKDLTVETKRLRPKFIRSSYANKNAVRYLAMACPDIVSPESWITPGTGSFRGFQQIFGGEVLTKAGRLSTKPTSDANIEIRRQFDVIISHPRYGDIQRHHYLNVEDKVCFFFKWLAMHSGWMKSK